MEEENVAIFKKGDKVRVVKYGHSEYVNNVMFDAAPAIVGKTGTVDDIRNLHGQFQYAVDGIDEKYAWYTEEQLVLFIITVN